METNDLYEVVLDCLPSETTDGVVGRGICESSPIDDLVTVTSLPPMNQLGQDMLSRHIILSVWWDHR